MTTHQENEPSTILGTGYNLEEGMRAVAMGDNGHIEMLYIIRQDRDPDHQGAFPVTPLAAAAMWNMAAELLGAPDQGSGFPVELRDIEAPGKPTRTLACGSPAATQLFGTEFADGTFRLSVGTSVQNAKGENLTRGDLEACVDALKEALANDEEFNHLKRELQD